MSFTGTSAARSVSPIALPALLIAVFIVPISIAGTATALPSIARDLGSNPTQLQWVLNGFNGSFALFTLVWGVLSDHVGYRRTFVIGAVLTILASILSAAAPNLLVLDFGRIAAGAGGAAIGTSVTSIISNAYQGAERGRNFALFGTVLGSGLAVGPTIAGGLVAVLGWRSVFGAFGIVIAVSLALSASVPQVRHERTPGARLLDTRLLRNARFMSIVLVPAIQAFGYIALLTYLPVALSAVYGLSPGSTGLFMIAMTGPVLVGPAIGARLVATRERITLHTIVYVSIALMLVGNAGMLLLAIRTPLWTLAIPMVLLGFSFGLPLGLLDGAAQGAVSDQSSGAAAGVMNFLRLGSEALVVGFYAAGLAALVASRVPDTDLAQRIAAGLPGHASTYIPGFVIGQLAILTAVLAGLAATVVLHRVATSGAGTNTEPREA